MGTNISKVNASLLNQVQSRQSCDHERDNDHCPYGELGCQFCGYAVVSLSYAMEHFTHDVTGGSPLDDIYFTAWQQSNSTVSVHTMSKSEWPNAYDYAINFCNIFNLFRNGNATEMNFNISIKYDACEFHPDTSDGYDAAYTHCNKY